ncbi:MAG: pilin [Patescibacteria group bacterium]
MTLSQLLSTGTWTKRVVSTAILVGVIAFAWLATPEVTLAQGLLPACAEAGDCTLCDVVGVFINFAALITEWLGVLAVLMFVIGGVFIIIAGGNPERAKRGRQIIGGTLFGSVIVVSGWLIINFTLAALLNADFDDVSLFPTVTDTGESAGGGEVWYELACTPVYQDCSGATDGSLCSDSTCDKNCVCSTGSCITYCDFLQVQGTFSSTVCQASTKACDAGYNPIDFWCDLSSAGEEQVCCVPQTN